MLGLWLIFLLIGALAIPIGRMKTGDYFSPAALFAASWCGTLALYFLKWLPYRAMRAQTLALIVAVISVVVLGAVFGQRLAVSRNRATRSLPRPDAWLIAYSVIGLVGVLWYVSAVGRILGWNAFMRGAVIRVALGNYTIPSTYLFLEFFCIAAPLLAFALVMSGTRVRPIVLVAPVMCALATWFTTDRTQFFVLMLGCFFVYVFRRGQQLSWRGFIVAGTVCAALLASNFLIVGAWLGKTPANLAVTVQVFSQSSAAAGRPRPNGSQFIDSVRLRIERWSQRGSTLYLYATGSFAALDVLLDERIVQPTRGLHTVYPIVRLLQRVGLIERAIPAPIPADRPLQLRSERDIEFNGYTFLYYPLMDFGFIGAVVYAACLGVLSGWAYGAARTRRESPAYLLLMAHLSTALVLSVFVNKFNNTASWYVAILTLLPFWLGHAHPRRTR